jgi:hypothetical protein
MKTPKPKFNNERSVLPSVITVLSLALLPFSSLTLAEDPPSNELYS